MRNTARVQQLAQAIRNWGRSGAQARRTGTLFVAVMPLLATIVLSAPLPPSPAAAPAPMSDTAAIRADAARPAAASPLAVGDLSTGATERSAQLRSTGASAFTLPERLAEPGTTAVDTGGELALSLSVSKVSGDAAGPIRAGDVLQYHAAVKNTGTRDWTAAAPLRFQSPLGDLLDDAVLSGTQQGALAKCGPGLWDSYYCKAMAVAGPTELSHPFALKAGASHFFSYRVQIRNNFDGDQALLSTVSVTGEPGNGEPRVEVSAALSDTVAVQHPGLAIVDQRVTKVVGDAAGPIRAGDVLQYHVTVQNTGAGDWTAGSKWAEERLVTFRTDLNGLLDDAVLTGVQQGNTARCGPGQWDSYYCKPTAVAGPTALEHEFALKAGAKHYFNYRVQISNSFVGDQELQSEASVSGETGNGQPRAEDSGTMSDTVAVQHPGLAIVDQRVTKVVGDAAGPIRAGDVLQYHVTVQNTGDGDWTAGSAWAEERLVTFSATLDGLLDDAVLTGVQQGSSARCGPGQWDSYYCKPTAVAGPAALEHEFALKAGAKHFFNYRVQISNSFVGDQELRSEAVVSGETGNGQPPAEDSGTLSDTVAVQHPGLAIVDQGVTKVVGDKTGPNRAGDVLQYHVAVQNTGDGDWTAESKWAQPRLVSFSTALDGLLDDAVLTGVQQGSSARCGPGQWDSYYCSSPTEAGPTQITHEFALRAGATHYFNYRVQLTDAYTGDQMLRNEACVFGEPGNGMPRVEDCGATDRELVKQFPELTIGKSVENLTRGQSAPARAGDVLEYTVTVTNPGVGDWSAGSPVLQGKLVRFSDDLSGVLDDAVWLRGSPDGCYVAGCEQLAAPVGDTIGHEFALKAGASRTMRYQVQLSDAFSGDQLLSNEACVTGDTRGPAGVLTECASTATPMVVQHPDLEIGMTWTKTPNANQALRAGDTVSYVITLHNPGPGDWNTASAWAVGNPVTLGKDLTDILDDAIVVGPISAGAVIDNGVLRWTGALAAGKTKQITFSVRVQNTAAGTANDLLLKGQACASGDSRNPALNPAVITVCTEAEIPVGERWRMGKTVFGADGSELAETANVRPGAVLEYRVSAEAVGGWPVAGVVLSDDLSRVLGIAELVGDIDFQVGNGPVQRLTVVDGVIRTPEFTLPGTGVATISYRVKIPADVHSGTLVNTAMGASTTGITPLRCGTATAPCTTSHTIATPKPVIDKQISAASPVQRGDIVTYTVRVTNPGPGVWSVRNPLSIVDDLARVLDDATLLGAPGAEVTLTRSTGGTESIPVTNGVISWSGPLGAGEWLVLSYSVQVNRDPAGGDRTLANEACTGKLGAERICDDVSAGIPVDEVEVDTPVWGGGDGDCVTPPWLDLPVTPGVIYTIAGEVKPGGSVTITATAKPGYTLKLPEGWTLAADGNSASYTVDFPTCEPQKTAYPDVKFTAGSCNADGTITPPSLELIETEGVEYRYTGEVKAGSTVVVTATAKPGYLLGSRWDNPGWVLSADRLTATRTITFPTPDCAENPGEQFIAPELPRWGGPSCLNPDTEPWLRLPETPGLSYTVSGEVKLGSTVVITVVADDGRKLGYNPHWSYAPDGKSATFTISFRLVGECDGGTGSGGLPPGFIEGPGEPENPGDGSGGDNNGDGDGGNETDPDPNTGSDIEVPPLPGIPLPECVNGTAVMPDLKVILVPGVWYDITGDITPGGTVVLTAYTLPGYILKDTADWMTGNWVVAPDRRSATQTITFPPLEEICTPPGETEKPGLPGGIEVPGGPGDPAGSTDPGGASGEVASTGVHGLVPAVAAGLALLAVGTWLLLRGARARARHRLG